MDNLSHFLDTRYRGIPSINKYNIKVTHFSKHHSKTANSKSLTQIYSINTVKNTTDVK